MISSQPSTITESVQLSPAQATSLPISPSVADSPTRDTSVVCPDTVLYTTLTQNCLVGNYEQQPPTPVDIHSDVTAATKYGYATVISPPHQQHLRTLDFSRPTSPTSSPSPFNSAQPCSSVTISTTSHQNQLYKQHQDHTSELPQHRYSAQASHLNFPDSREQFYKSDPSDTNSNGSPHHTHTDSPRYQLHADLVPVFPDLQQFTFITDINNNNSNNNSCSSSPGYTDPTISCDYSFDTSRFRYTSGRISPLYTDRNRGKLPPFSALLSNSSGKQGVLESTTMMKSHQTQFDESDDSGVSSLEEESHYTNLTNVPQTSHENGHCYGYDTHEPSFGDWSMSEHINLKNEPNSSFELNDIFNFGADILFADNSDDFNMDSPSPDSDECESSRADRVPLSQRLSFTNTDTYRSVNDAGIHQYSEHESFLTDGEDPVLEDTLPNFSKLQNLGELDKVSHYMRSSSSSPKKKRKAVRESPSYVEKERRKPGRKPGQVSNVLHLWEFMRDLLHSSENQGIIEWISKPEGVFRVMNSTEVARLWGEKKKNKKKMTYEKLSRSLRYSRLEGYFADLPRDKNYPKKLCFKFGPKSKDWH